MRFSPILCLFLVTISCTVAVNAADNPVELGEVDWNRDLEESLTIAQHQSKPVFLLFQEIPGCSTCRVFGRNPLSHPLLVEAIETEFIPVAVYNNRPGRDEKIRKTYNEPAWNFPVIRFVDEDGEDILSRKDRIWSTAGVADRMLNALKRAGKKQPAYLKLVASESNTDNLETATFAMHCFWTGEGRLGSIDGVVTTRAGWLDSREVVEVTFDPEDISYEKLVKAADSARCATRAYAEDKQQLTTAKGVLGSRAVSSPGRTRSARDSDQKFALKRSPLKYLPLTPAQATKVNAALRRGKSPKRWLSPRQMTLLVAIQETLAENPSALDDLQRPDSIKQLAAYQSRLVEKIKSAKQSI